MTTIKAEQRQDEPADLFLMRIFLMAAGELEPHVLLAAATWMYSTAKERPASLPEKK
jgi:hypothetical protein